MRRILAIGLVVTLSLQFLSGCNEKTEERQTIAASGSSVSEELLPDGEGKVLNIYSWNDEFSVHLEEYYPGYNKKTQTIGDVKVNFIEEAAEDGWYQKKLDKALSKQGEAKPDEKVDIFLCETAFAKKYIESENAENIRALGLKEADMEQMYPFTKQVATDSGGVLKGVTWQLCPGGFVYRRSYAKEIFGTDDPVEIQKLVSDWDTFTETAKQIKEKSAGKIAMLAGNEDLFYTYFCNAETPCVNENNEIVFSKSVSDWMDVSKQYTAEGLSCGNAVWSEEWYQGFEKGVFGYFMPSWGVNFILPYGGNEEEKLLESYGDWGMVEGPQPYYWGGSYVCAAKGTDNAALVADIMKKLCCEEEAMYKMSKDMQEFVNNKTVNAKIVEKGEKTEVLGGQSLTAVLSDVAEKMDSSSLSPYDMIFEENMLYYCNAIREFYQGEISKEDAIQRFKEKMKKSCPELIG